MIDTSLNHPELPGNSPFILLDNSLGNTEEKLSYLFMEPVEILICESPEKIGDCLDKIAEGVKSGLYAAGWFSYETGYQLESKLSNLMPPDRKYPLIWFGLFSNYLPLTNNEVSELLDVNSMNAPSAFQIKNLSPNICKSDYIQSVRKLKQYLKNGDTYQVNYTFKYKFEFRGNAFQLYKKLRGNQKCEFGALLRTENEMIMSLSPELFVRKDSDSLICKPMKGTIKRGQSEKEDETLAHHLQNDPKSIAENMIIVDLLRNDLGKVSEIGSVKVSNVLEIEKYKTLFQMTSTIEGKADKDKSIIEYIKHLFPCGSVTGAPKIRTMEIINEIELEPREIYTGSIGCFFPDNSFCLNVAIRTLIITNDSKGEMGIGSAIVNDSNVDDEYQECLLKAKFLFQSKDQ